MLKTHLISIAVIVVIIQTGKVTGHPQCLDFFPPFASSRPNGFCKESSNYGCCSSSKETYLVQLHKHAMRTRQRLGAPLECDHFVRDILCSECHPYAAHIYDAEIPLRTKSRFSKSTERFPGLCFDFCIKSFKTCRAVILALPWNEGFRSFIAKSKSNSFCKWAVPGDKHYCFPEVNNVAKVQYKKLISDSLTTMCVQPIVYDLHNPLVAVHANDGSHRLFVGEQRGIVYIIDAKGKKLEKPFLNISEKILNSGQGWDERGFLGLVFHPKYAKNGRFFVYYSMTNKENEAVGSERPWHLSSNHKTRIAEYTVSSYDPNVADVNSEIILLEINQPEANHEGGMMLFGDDGFLYIFIGDGGGAGDKHGSIGNALNVTTLLGKVLRIDIDVFDGRRYAIPKDNPFIRTKNARPEIYAYGVRNMWRCSKDRGNPKTRKGKGRIFCGDVGQDAYEEVDIIEKGGNYGWRAMEGNSCYDDALCGSPLLAKSIRPILAYNHSIGKSVVGGYVYRGCSNPNLEGRYFYADTVSSRIFVAKEDQSTGAWASQEVIMGNSSICNKALYGNYAKTILSFGEDEAGEIYILSTYWPSATRPYGILYKLVDPTRRSDPESCQFQPKSPKIFVQKRYINDKKKIQSNTILSERQKTTCVDTKAFCRNIMSFPQLCKIFEVVTKFNCKRSCGYC